MFVNVPFIKAYLDLLKECTVQKLWKEFSSRGQFSDVVDWATGRASGL